MSLIVKALRTCFATFRRSSNDEGPTVDGTPKPDENGGSCHVSTTTIRHSRSVPSLQHYRQQRHSTGVTNVISVTSNQQHIVTNPRIRRSTSRGRINGILRQPSQEAPGNYQEVEEELSLRRSRRSFTSTTSLAIRDPDLPVPSLIGPPPPPRPATIRPAYSHTGLSNRDKIESTRSRSSEMMKLRRSTSESKMEKDRRNEERAVKSRSVHFDGNKKHDDFTFEHISIIGRNAESPPTRNSENEKEMDVFSSGEDLPPPPPGKRKVIVAQRPNNFIWALKSKIRRKGKRKSESPPTDDEGFESPTSPTSPTGDATVVTNGNVVKAFDKFAPLAMEEDLESHEVESIPYENGISSNIGPNLGEKHELEETREKTTAPTTSSTAIATTANNNSKEQPKELTPEEKKKLLRKFSFFHLKVHVVSGKDLLAMDRGGTSDPYLKCMHGQDKLFQTRSITKTVNPVWDENFDSYIDNPFRPITLQVFDKDMVGSDDFMGEVGVELTDLTLSKQQDFSLELRDGNNEDLIKKNKKRKPLGFIQVRISLTPMTKEEMNERFCQAVSGDGWLAESPNNVLEEEGPHGKKQFQILRAEKMGKGGKGKTLSWSAVVHVVLVQAHSLTAMDAGESSDPYCKIALGRERQKSKSISNTVNPKWRESFDFYWYEELDNTMEITIWDKDVGSKDDFMGRIVVDLRELRKETTHNIWRDVEEGDGRVNFLITISGTTRGDSPSNLANWEEELNKMKKLWIERYQTPNTFKNMKDVGHLMVKVFKAQGLASADLGGKSDPFCVVELCNDRVLTHTEYKTLTPAWHKVFQFDVKDIHDVLEFTVYDEDKDHKYEFLGRAKIPLLRIRNDERRWVKLKDKKLRGPAKGDNPQILVECFFVYNKFRAGIRTINPKQLKYEDKSDIKFKHSVFMRNVNRIKAATADFDPELAIREWQSIINWDNTGKSIGAFIGFMLGVYFFEPWMIPLGLVIPFLKNIIVLSVTGGWKHVLDDDEEDDDDDQDEGQTKDKDGQEKKSLKEKMQQMQEITLMVQNGLGLLAHVLESIGNVFNFSVPFLSWLAFIALTAGTIILYFIPLRYLLLAWGLNKFTKKLIRPWAINNNELVDFISRVPDNEELKDYREIPSEDAVKAKLQSKKKAPADRDII